MEATYRTKAIVLRRVSFGEYNSMVSVYTGDKGRRDLVARGTKKLKSKLAGHLEPINRSEIMVVGGKQYDYIGAAVSENCFLNIKEDLDLVTLTGQSLNAFNKLVREEVGDEEMFQLLEAYLELMNTGISKDKLEQARLLTNGFLIKTLAILGSSPELYACVDCRKKLSPENYRFSLDRGGLICPDCAKKNQSTNNAATLLTTNDPCVKVLRFAIENPLGQLIKIKLNENINNEVNKIVRSFLNYNIS